MGNTISNDRQLDGAAELFSIPSNCRTQSEMNSETVAKDGTNKDQAGGHVKQSLTNDSNKDDNSNGQKYYQYLASSSMSAKRNSLPLERSTRNSPRHVLGHKTKYDSDVILGNEDRSVRERPSSKAGSFNNRMYLGDNKIQRNGWNHRDHSKSRMNGSKSPKSPLVRRLTKSPKKQSNSAPNIFENFLDQPSDDAGNTHRMTTTAMNKDGKWQDQPKLRRCRSSSPRGIMYRKEVINQAMQERLETLRNRKSSIVGNSSEMIPPKSIESRREEDNKPYVEEDYLSCSRGSQRMTKEKRNRRRDQQIKDIINDLCEIVTDLFVAEQSLFSNEDEATQNDTSSAEGRREISIRAIREFLSELPIRYAFGVETPSEVLVHMRLVAAARSDDAHAAVHVTNFEESSSRYSSCRDLKMITISCSDRPGLLEYITGKLLATGGSRVMDADVMTTTDDIALDRFVVDVSGRLRLDKLKEYIEQYLRKSKREMEPHSCSNHGSDNKVNLPSSSPTLCGNIYEQNYHRELTREESIREEVQSAVPLSTIIGRASTEDVDNTCSSNIANSNNRIPSNPRRYHERSSSSSSSVPVKNSSSPSQTSGDESAEQRPLHHQIEEDSPPHSSYNATTFVDKTIVENNSYFDNNNYLNTGGSQRGLLDTLLRKQEERIPEIPFEDLMISEALGAGRASAIYRAIWQKTEPGQQQKTLQEVALKVALVEDPAFASDNIAELQQEADIAWSLDHFNICKMVGIARDQEHLCLAHEYCERGSLQNLLSDTARCYEYLPIALDIANGMAYLHSRNVIHRDLKPANILLGKDYRAKIADFGMSVTNTGQELTAETGTYRWMAPEVIRHESYSSNADVYSFGVVLFQLITREVPFATLTPVQTAYAVAEGYRPEIPPSTPEPLRRIIMSCWDEDAERRPSFTYVAMALADYAKLAFNPANVGAQTLEIADEMLANVAGNSTVNVDFSVPMSNRRNTSMNDTTSLSMSSSLQQQYHPHPHLPSSLTNACSPRSSSSYAGYVPRGSYTNTNSTIGFSRSFTRSGVGGFSGLGVSSSGAPPPPRKVFSNSIHPHSFQGPPRTSTSRRSSMTSGSLPRNVGLPI